MHLKKKKKFFTARREILIMFVIVKGKYSAVVLSVQYSRPLLSACVFGVSAWRKADAPPQTPPPQAHGFEEGKEKNTLTTKTLCL